VAIAQATSTATRRSLRGSSALTAWISVSSAHEGHRPRPRARPEHGARDVAHGEHDAERHEQAHDARGEREDGHHRHVHEGLDHVVRRERRRAHERHEGHRQREHREEEQVQRRVGEVVARGHGLHDPGEEVARGDAVDVPAVRGGQAPADPGHVEDGDGEQQPALERVELREGRREHPRETQDRPKNVGEQAANHAART
jgi:hypothetical protein